MRGWNKSSGDEGGVMITVTGVFCALKHWICKHFHVSHTTILQMGKPVTKWAIQLESGQEVKIWDSW